MHPPHSEPTRSADRYRAITAANVVRTPYWSQLTEGVRESVEVVSRVLPFRLNPYVAEALIDWRSAPDDPMFQLTVPQREMLDPEDYERVRNALRRQAPREELASIVRRVQLGMNPHPAGQSTHNVPVLDGEPLPGIQHKYRETVLFFPSRGQTCHAYCTYCFRWAQFVDLPAMRFQAREADHLVAYLRAHPEVSDVLITGGDPLIMKTKHLRAIIEPLLAADLPGLAHIRIGTKALAFWPQRLVTDDDADDLLRLFESVVTSGRHLALMAHYSHPRELSTPIARAAVARARAAGAEIRLQAPLARHVNDNAATWADLWTTATRLGMIPYYLFVARDTGPKHYFEVPLARAYRIFRDAYSRVSGLARTVRGPSMSAHPGKVRILGTSMIGDERCFVLDFLQARNPAWVRRPFFARYDPDAVWLDDLVPALGADRFLFESERLPDSVPDLAEASADPYPTTPTPPAPRRS